MTEWLFEQPDRARTKSLEEKKKTEEFPLETERIMSNALDSFVATMQARKFKWFHPSSLDNLWQRRAEIVSGMVRTAERGRAEEETLPLLILELAAIRAREAAMQIEHGWKSMYKDEGKEVPAEERVAHLFESSKREEFLRLMDAIRSRADIVEQVYTRGDFMEWLGEVRKKLIKRLNTLKLNEGTKEALEDRVETIERFLKKESGGEELISMVLREDINDFVSGAEKRVFPLLCRPQRVASQNRLREVLKELLKREQFFVFLSGEE